MYGNVYEWCEDRWHDDYNGAPTDGSAWLSGGTESRVVRGGSFTRNTLRSSLQNPFTSKPREADTGFRVVAYR